MLRLVFSLSVTFLCSIIASIIGVAYIGQHSLVNHLENDPSQVISGIYRLIQDQFESSTAETQNQTAQKISQLLDCPVRIVDYDPSFLPERLSNQPLTDKPILDAILRIAYFPIHQEKQLVIIGPIPTFQPPANWFYAIISACYVAFVLVLTAFAIGIPIIRYMKKLELATRQISAGDFSARAPLPSYHVLGFSKYFRNFALLFNRMAEATENTFKHQQKIFQAVAHEVRTPIARTRFALDLLAITEDQEQREKHLAAIDSDMEEIDSLVSELITFNRFDNRSNFTQPPLNLQIFNPYEILNQLINQLRFLENGRSLTLTGPQEMPWIQADIKAFERATSNIIRNALRYAVSKVEVQIAERDQCVEIRVKDDGPGVPESDRKRIFEPFVRVDDSRNRKSGGTGLGLAITARIVQSHHGQLYVEEAPGGGACFVSTWSKVASPDASSGD